MGIDLMRETRARIEVNPKTIEGCIILVSEFMKGSFVAWLRDDINKYTVKARGNEDSLAQHVETAFQEGSDDTVLDIKQKMQNSQQMAKEK
jgi:hypothetical protein